MSSLRGALDELDEVLRAEAPAVHARLRPGLSADDIVALQASLAPFRLADDAVEVYRWHDGMDGDVSEGGPFLDEDFRPSAEAVETYRWMVDFRDDGLPFNGRTWWPAWFPLFGTQQHGAMVTLEPRSSPAADVLWSFSNFDAEITGRYDSVESMVRTTAALWRRRLLPWVFGDEPERNAERLALVVASNPGCFPEPGVWPQPLRHRASPYEPETWLPDWGPPPAEAEVG